jgi:hypothetical protein
VIECLPIKQEAGRERKTEREREGERERERERIKQGDWVERGEWSGVAIYRVVKKTSLRRKI